jgi:hypothetical protein
MSSLLDNVRKSVFGDPTLQPTNVVSELAGAGTAFATLIEGVGTAVAKTQAELDATSGHIASEMANTQVDTVQALVTNYDDSGNITDVSVVSGQTSALAIAVPPALSFKRVHLEGSFVAGEFSAAQHSNVNVNLIGVSVGGKGLRGLSASGSVVNANTDVQTEQTQDTSVASMSMTAQIRPKPVTALPKPPLVLKGPKLALLRLPLPLPPSSSPPPLAVDVIHAGPSPSQPSDPPYLERRNALIKVQLTDSTGAGINGKTIAFDSGSLDWIVTNETGASVSTGPVTASVTIQSVTEKGVFYIVVSRTATASTDPKQTFVVRASLNLVNTTLNISL